MRDFRLLKKLDIYIIRKFLGTFFYAIGLIISISIVFDLSENIDEFIENEAPFRAIVFDYYLNFIPYFANLFSGLFTFIAVIFFTSKMAFNSEIIALLSSGVSYNRFLRPFMISAFVIAAFSYSLGNYIIPPANRKMIDFKYDYIKKKSANRDRDIHRQIEPNVYIYMERFDSNNDYGRKFSIERFEDRKLVSKLNSDFIRWDREKKTWTITNYVIRDIDGYKETITKGSRIDTTLAIYPEEFKTKKEDIECMNFFDLLNYIDQQKLRGVDAIEQYEVERHRRAAVPFSSFILTIMGVSLASRKIRGGLGLHLGFGILGAFTYIMFLQVTKTFAISGTISPMLSMWLPNIIYAVIAFFLYRWASR
ncbi:MAG: LptF/LptG family permease [Prolixibacteraceae bacterium]|jgi:lipopolysaccharide export system permease protein|nr:LptF/LptG family permease [Prolixibacteraceae bacterium]